MITFFLYNDKGVLSNELEVQDEELQLIEILEEHNLYRLNWETHLLQGYSIPSKAVINIAKANCTAEKWDKVKAFFARLEDFIKTNVDDIMLELDLLFVHKSGAHAGVSFYFDMRQKFSLNDTDTNIELRDSVLENEY